MTTYYVNLGFTLFLVLMSIWGFTTIRRKTGQKMLFWLFFGIAWAFLAISHIFTISGAASGVWYMMTLRVGGYCFMIISIIGLMIHIINRDSLN
jgi:hypothetical protein